VLGPYIQFTYLFVVSIQYEFGAVDYFTPTFYNWHFRKLYHVSDVIINTTSPLLNYTFESADSYQYYVNVSNAVSFKRTNKASLTGNYVFAKHYTSTTG